MGLSIKISRRSAGVQLSTFGSTEFGDCLRSGNTLHPMCCLPGAVGGYRERCHVIPMSSDAGTRQNRLTFRKPETRRINQIAVGITRHHPTKRLRLPLASANAGRKRVAAPLQSNAGLAY